MCHFDIKTIFQMSGFFIAPYSDFETYVNKKNNNNKPHKDIDTSHP